MRTKAYSFASLILLAGIASATDYPLLAAKNLTVQPAGPRQGNNGLRFLNIEGNDLGSFASFGVIEFDPNSLPTGPDYATFSAIRFQIGQANAAFTTTSGLLDIFITQDNAQAFDQTNTNLAFDTANLPSGIDSDLLPLGSPLIDAGDLDFIHTNENGSVYDVTLSLNAAAQTYFQNRLTNLQPIRLVVASSPNSASPNGVTATLAGYNNTSVQGPTLVFTVGSNSVLSGTLDLQNWIGDTTAQTATIEIVSGTTAVETFANVALDASGNFSVNPTVAAGSYDVYASVMPHWLKKKVGTFTLGGSVTGANASLINGDVDGDNVVSVFDYIQLSEAFDSTVGDPTWNVNADLDGDLVISVFDYIILSDNFDKQGDSF